MTVLLVVSTLYLLVFSTLASTNLNIIIDEAAKYNETLNKEFFVDDVRPLVEDGCKDQFFCKVHEILHQRQESSTNILKNNLKAFTKHVNCSELLKDVHPSGVRIQLPELIRHLTTCAQQRNWNKARKSRR